MSSTISECYFSEGRMLLKNYYEYYLIFLSFLFSGLDNIPNLW